jgi:hypothetical protein
MNTNLIDKLRTYKVFDIAIFDMGSSILGSSFLGSRLGYDPIFSGLISVPLSIGLHMLVNVETELTRFYKSDSPHKYHGIAIGAGIGVASYMLGSSNINSVNIGLGTSIASTLYMKQYGHNLPPKLKRWLMKKYIKHIA